MPEAQRNLFQAEWKPVQAALLLDPRNRSANGRADEILSKYRIPAAALAQVPALPPSPALQLWRKLVPMVSGNMVSGNMVSANNLDAARRELTKSREASGGLYRELLFDAVDSRLGPSAPMSPLAGTVRALLAESDGASAALETQFHKWERNRKNVFGGGSPMAELVSRYIEAFPAARPPPRSIRHFLRPRFLWALSWLRLARCRSSRRLPFRKAGRMRRFLFLCWRKRCGVAGAMRPA